MAISAGPTGPFVLSLSKDRLRVFGLTEIANPRIEYGVAMTKWVRTRKRSSLTPPAVVGYDESVVNPAQACDHNVGI